MKILVCIKQVPDTAATPRVKADGTGIETDGLEYVINPYDEYALEEALKIRDSAGDSTVTVLTVAPERATKALRTALATGANDAIHVKDEAFDGLDSLGAARVAAQTIRKSEVSYDLIFCGRQAVDDDMGAFGPALAEYLDVPQATDVTSVTIDASAGKVTCVQEADIGEVVVELPLPAVILAQKGLNEPRYASLKGIMMAKKKPLAVMANSDIGVPDDQFGPSSAGSTLVRLERPAPKTPIGNIMKADDLQSTVKEVVRLLKEEAKVI